MAPELQNAVHACRAIMESDSAASTDKSKKSLHAPTTIVGARGIAAPPLPDGWESAEDPASGQTYYFHLATSKVQWNPPSGAPPPPPPPPIVVEDRNVTLPGYWTKVTLAALDRDGDGQVNFDEAGEASSQRVPLSSKVRRAVQSLMDNTWKDQVTRDRKASLGKFEVVQVVRNENAKLWRDYFRARERVFQQCMQLGDRFCSQKVKTGPDAAGAELEECLGQEVLALLDDANEFYLFHGTKPSSATAICETNFCTKRAGSAVGTLYGPGLYFAECSSKSDEYAKDDDAGPYQGLYAMLLCRVTCGNCRYTDAVRPSVAKLLQDLETGEYHSVLGDREKARGTYREFVCFEADLAYPEYIIIYRRLIEDD